MDVTALNVQISADVSELTEAVKKITEQVNQVAQSAQQMGAKANEGFQTAGKGADSFIGSIKALLPQLDLAFTAIEACMEAATEADTAFRKLQFTTEKIGGASPAVFKELIDWTEQYAQSLNLLYKPEELEAAEAQLSTIGLTTDQIKELIPHIVDLASVTDGNLANATQKSIQALMGHGRALVDVGIKMDNTGTITGNLAEVVQKLSKIQGEAASQLDSFANKDKEMQHQLEADEELIGNKLIPIWQKLKGTIVGGIAAMFRSDEENHQAELQQTTKDLQEQADHWLALAHAQGISANMYDQYMAQYGHYMQLINEKGAMASDATLGTNSYMNFLGDGSPLAESYKPNTEKGLAGTADDIIKNEGDGTAVATDKIKTFSEIVKTARNEFMLLGNTKTDSLAGQIDEVTASLKKLADMGETSGARVKELSDGLKQLQGEQAAEAMTPKTQSMTIAPPQVGGLVGDQTLQMVQGLDAADVAANKLLNTLDAIKSMGKEVGQVAGQIGEVMSNSIAAAISGQKFNPLAALANAMAGALAKYGALLISTGTAMLFGGDPAGGPKLAEGLGLEGVAGLFKGLAAQKFATGGIVSSSTFANIGEYAGASHNSEVVAPLDKLRGMLNTGGGGSDYRFRIMGDDLLSMQDRIQNNSQFVMGTNNQ
ncbi:MAG: hypothetical protein ACLQQ4_09550 [Bacteroidia bacterium]